MAALLRPKRGSQVGKTKRGKGSKIMAVPDRHGLRVAVCVASAAPHEVKLVPPPLAEMVAAEVLANLIGDAAYDSDAFDAELGPCGLKLIARNGGNRDKDQPGRPRPPPLLPTVESRAVVLLAPRLPPPGRSVWTPRREFPRNDRSCLLDYPLDAFMSWVHVLQTDVLPVGVTPITAVPTRIVHALQPRGRVRFADRQAEELALEGLSEFVTEQLNPGNTKHVTRLGVELPSPRLRDSVAFVDRPGLGSLAGAGAAETTAYFCRAAIPAWS